MAYNSYDSIRKYMQYDLGNKNTALCLRWKICHSGDIDRLITFILLMVFS